jgi:hypothetical protein
MHAEVQTVYGRRASRGFKAVPKIGGVNRGGAESRLGKMISDSHAVLLRWIIGQTFVVLGGVAALHFMK